MHPLPRRTLALAGGLALTSTLLVSPGAAGARTSDVRITSLSPAALASIARIKVAARSAFVGMFASRLVIR